MSQVCLVESLARYVGQTVTIYTASGGMSGEGFTGVLAYVGNDCIKLITGIGAAPACSIGSSCTGWGNNNSYGGYGGYGGFGYSGNWLGSVTEIPICKIACFTHNAI
ncbi:hypothetical protein LJB89_04065 [Tyzzerella sp. OttesenSCG-928-J15]|nr:hypothetical protein [Tyzzerella sp. OttesenSCG-928-J15]